MGDDDIPHYTTLQHWMRQIWNLGALKALGRLVLCVAGLWGCLTCVESGVLFQEMFHVFLFRNLRVLEYVKPQANPST